MPKQTVEIPFEDEGARLKALGRITPLEVREANREIVRAIYEVSQRIITENGFSDEPRSYSNFAGRINGDSRYARYLREAASSGLALHYSASSWDGSLELSFGYMEELKEAGDHGEIIYGAKHHADVHEFTLDFAKRLGFLPPGETDPTLVLGKRIPHSNLPFTALLLPAEYDGWSLVDGVNIAHISVNTRPRDSVFDRRRLPVSR